MQEREGTMKAKDEKDLLMCFGGRKARVGAGLRNW